MWAVSSLYDSMYLFKPWVWGTSLAHTFLVAKRVKSLFIPFCTSSTISTLPTPFCRNRSRRLQIQRTWSLFLTHAGSLAHSPIA